MMTPPGFSFLFALSEAMMNESRKFRSCVVFCQLQHLAPARVVLQDFSNLCGERSNSGVVVPPSMFSSACSGRLRFFLAL